jgi:hypothetical protein
VSRTALPEELRTEARRLLRYYSPPEAIAAVDELIGLARRRHQTNRALAEVMRGMSLPREAVYWEEVAVTDDLCLQNCLALRAMLAAHFA